MSAWTRGRAGGIAVAALLTCVVTVALAGCGGSDSSAPADTTVSVSVDDALRAQLPQAVRDAGVLRVGMDPTYPPFEYLEDGTPHGFDVDLANALAGKLGLQAEITRSSFDGLIPALRSDRFDVIISGMYDSPDRRQLVDFVDYYRDVFLVVLARSDADPVTEFADLCGKSVAVIRASSEASAIDEINKEECQSSPIQSVILPDGNAAVLAVKSGQADYFLTSRPVAAFTVDSAGGSGLEIMQLKDLPSSYGTPPDYPEVFPNGMAFRKDDTQLRDAVRGALLALIDDGTYAELLKQYGISDISYTSATVNGEQPKQQ